MTVGLAATGVELMAGRIATGAKGGLFDGRRVCYGGKRGFS